MDAPSAEERAAFLWMQGRMVELLLRHDVARFGHTFDPRTALPEDDPRLARYRALAVLFYLRDELFDSLLPRIQARLSFASPREVRIEEAPTRGRIDWARTAAASMHERPGHPPLQVYTRARRRHFATPENLLTVVTILEYQAVAERLRDSELAEQGSGALRHPLNDLLETCRRALVFPQFAGILADCQVILTGTGARTAGDLEQDVAENLQPGHNTAYDELLAWRLLFHRLRLLEQIAPVLQPMLGADPDHDNYLYQLWLFYELADLLAHDDRVITWDRFKMILRFTWGTPAREYRLQHDQGIPQYWRNAPGVRPDFYVARADREEVRDGPEVIWHEPGYVLDAKYYKPRDSDRAPSSPVKRMIADLTLTGERHGALLFAFQTPRPEPVGGADVAGPAPDAAPPAPASLYAIVPIFRQAQAFASDTQIAVWRMPPRPAAADAPLAQTLRQLLDAVHAALEARIAVRCHGVFLDSLTARADGTLAQAAGLLHRDGTAASADLDDLVLCPKPHVAPWRVDLVSRSRDCCRNAAVCHIAGRPDVQVPTRLTRLEDIHTAIRSANAGQDADSVVRVATQQVLVITRRYADLIQWDIAEYTNWAREALDVGELFGHTPLITDVQRETLGLGRFIWEQVERIHAYNYAGPALLFTGVLEWATQQSIYKVLREAQQPLVDSKGRLLQETLGTLGNSVKFDRGANANKIVQVVAAQGGYWNGQICPLANWLEAVRSIVDIRNHAAHQANVDLTEFQVLKRVFFGSQSVGYGLLAQLLLAWQPAGRSA